MRPNIRMTSEELMLAQVLRAQELRKREVMPEEEDLEIYAYGAVFCIVFTLILMVLAIA